MIKEAKKAVSEKKLVINLSGNKPDYTFEGNFTGFDIRLVQHGLIRAYRTHNLDLRKTKEANTKSNQGATK